jgi:hypothetical protein
MRGRISLSHGDGPNRSAIFKYGLAVVCVAAGVFLSQLLQPVLRILHGTIRVDSAPSRGTRITVSVPAKSLATMSPA